MCFYEETFKMYMERFIGENYNELSCAIDDLNNKNTGLCCLRNVNFNCGGIPDYSDPAQRSLYLLRYGPSYITEYRAAYEEIFRFNHVIRGDIKVLSIGCGSFLDKASAHYAMKRYANFNKFDLIYYGVDIKNWGRDFFPFEKHIFINKGIARVELSEIREPIDIIIFPKSLPEIDPESLEACLSKLSEHNFENKVCIINSNRESKSDFNKAHDFMVSLSEKIGYTLYDTIVINECYGNNNKTSRNIWSVLERFSFSQKAITISREIFSACKFKISHECDDACNEVIDRYPVLTTGHYNTCVYCLENKHAMGYGCY